MKPALFVGWMFLMAASAGAGAQQMQGQGGYRGPSTEQPVLTPAQKARLAQTDALQTAIVNRDGDAVRRLVAGGMSVDLNFDEAYRAECAQMRRECHSIEATRLATVDPPTLAHLKGRGLDLDRAATSGLTALTSLLLEPPQMRVAARRADGSIGPAIEPPADLPRIRALLEQGADPNRRFREYTPLMIAVGVPQKAPALADALVEFGGRVEFEYTVVKLPRDKPAGAYPLPATSTMALAILAEPPVRDDSGLLRDRTVGPLTWLVLHRRGDLAARILERERKLAAPDRFLLYFAAMLGEWDVVMKALPYAREIDAADRAGVTPLLLADDDGRVDVVKALVAARANVNARTDRDWPPLWETPPGMWFMGHGPSKPRLVGGYTPLKVAKQRGREDIARILVQAGARE